MFLSSCTNSVYTEWQDALLPKSKTAEKITLLRGLWHHLLQLDNLLGHLGRRVAPVALAGAATDRHQLQDIGQTGGQSVEDSRARVLERDARAKLASSRTSQ